MGALQIFVIVFPDSLDIKSNEIYFFIYDSGKHYDKSVP